MVLVAASLGLVLYSVAGISGTESAIAALAALTFMILYNAVSMRLRDRTDVGSQIADLSRGTADLARQVAEFGRRLSAVEGRIVSANSTGADRIQSVVGEINELGTLVKQLAASVASHEDMLTVVRPPSAPPAGEPRKEPSPTTDDRPAGFALVDAPLPAATGMSCSQSQTLAAVRSAVDENRIDIYLQPMVTLPQRKVRYYEAVTRLRDDKDQILAAEEFIGIAEAGGLIGRIDNMVMLRCVQVLRRLMVRNKDIGIFCNVSAATLGSTAWMSSGMTSRLSSMKAQARAALSTATRSIISCAIAPPIGGKYPKAAATMPRTLRAMPPTALSRAIDRIRRPM